MTLLRLSSTLILAFLFGWTAASSGADTPVGPPTPPPFTGATPPPPPPPPPPPQQLKVYYAANGQALGPFTGEELKAKIAAGEVNRQTLVWMEGMTDWQAAATVAAVAPLLTAVPPQVTFDAAGYLVGTWESRETVAIPGQGQAEVQLSVTYRADGTVTGFGTLTSQTVYGPFTMTISLKGTWTAETKSENSFVLTPNTQVTYSSSYSAPNTSTSTTPALMTVIDRNTVQNQTGTRAFRVSN